MSSLASFVRRLTESGRAVVSTADEDVDLAGLDEALAELDAIARAEAPADAPAFDLDAARYGARKVHEACRFLVSRATEANRVRSALASPGPPNSTAENIWSADLCLRYLPGLHARAALVAPEDPLVVALSELCQRWPLSGIGVTKTGSLLVDGPVAKAIRTSPGLRRTLVDRVLASGDAELAEIPWISAAIDETIGACPELLPRTWKQRDG